MKVKLKIKHWHEWINPWAWHKKRKIERFLNWVIEKDGMEAKAAKAMEDLLIQGYSIMEFKEKV